MDKRTFWMGMLGGLVGGAVLVGAGYVAVKSYLPSQENDPLYKMKRSFIPSGTVVSRSGAWDEILFLYRERDVPGVGSSLIS